MDEHDVFSTIFFGSDPTNVYEVIVRGDVEGRQTRGRDCGVGCLSVEVSTVPPRSGTIIDPGGRSFFALDATAERGRRRC